MRCSLYIMIKPGSQMVTDKFLVGKGNYCKIGIAENVEQRHYQLDCHPEEIEIIAEYEFLSRKEALDCEQLLHKMLRIKNVRKEWFYLRQEELATIDNVIVDFFHGMPHYDAKHYLEPKETDDWRECLVTEKPYAN